MGPLNVEQRGYAALEDYNGEGGGERFMYYFRPSFETELVKLGAG